MNHKLLITSFLWTILTALPSMAQTATSIRAVENAVEQLAQRPGMEAASLGVAVMRLGPDSEIVIDVNGKRSLIPASTMKILTSVTALELLGPETIFETVLGYGGTLDAGVLQGDLIIRGGGDPTLAEDGWGDLFDHWTQAVKKAGIRSIAGRVVGDASYYQGAPRPGTWTWKDLGNYYASGAEGLNFHKNAYEITFLPGAVGEPAKFLGTTPKLAGVTFHNAMRTGSAGSGDQGYVYAAPYNDVIFLRGSVPAGGVFTIKGALPEPALTCAQLFQAHLQKHGIGIAKEAATARMPDAAGSSADAFQEIFRMPSPTLADLLPRMNHKSINLFAETILRRLGKVRDGSGSTEAGVEAIEAYFAKHGITTTGLTVHDGSGLSHSNLITPRQMVHVLGAADEGPHSSIFRRSLPVAGKSGTLANVGRGTSAAGRVHAKSGTLERVKCYAGYAEARSGTRYSFAIMVNHYAKTYGDVKPGIETLLARIADL